MASCQTRNIFTKRVREKSKECHNHKKGKKKVLGVPQSQTAAFPRPQDRSSSQTQREGGNRQNHTSATRTNVRKALSLALFSLSEVIAMLEHEVRHNTNRLVE